MKIFKTIIREHKKQVVYCSRFLGLFCVLFYGTELVIGLSTPEGSYNSFVASHLNFVDPFRRTLLRSTQSLLSAMGYQTYFRNPFTLSFVGGKGIRMVYSCLGYGLLSFWIAFVFANGGGWKRKAGWMLGGCLALIIINVLRLSLVLLADNKGWPIPLGWDHHTWFNIIAYLLIFLMIYCFDRSNKRVLFKQSEKNLHTTPEAAIRQQKNLPSPLQT